jgi:hypothetical protein
MNLLRVLYRVLGQDWMNKRKYLVGNYRNLERFRNIFGKIMKIESFDKNHFESMDTFRLSPVNEPGPKLESFGLSRYNWLFFNRSSPKIWKKNKKEWTSIMVELFNGKHVTRTWTFRVQESQSNNIHASKSRIPQTIAICVMT